MTKSRKMRKGGFWESVTSGWGSVTQGATSGWNSVSDSASSFWNPKKNTSSSSTSSTTSTSTPSTTTYTPSTPSTTPSTTTYTPSTGGSRKKRMRGGCNGKNLADHAAPYHGSSTAQAKWVGGKRTRRHKKKRSTRRH